MKNNDSFIELVNSVCKRRHIYVVGGTFYEVCAYFTGYANGSQECPLSGDGWQAFNSFVCARFRFPAKYCWPYVLKQCSSDDEEATTQLQILLTEFAARVKTESYEEIVKDMMSRASNQEEGEPEKAWRRFSRAIHRSDRNEIESLVQNHPDAEILWSATYPEDVALLMDQIAESYLVSQISGSEAEGEVTIITPDFGPIAVKLIGEDWRIDATKIIDCWKANRNEKAQQEETPSE